MIRVSWCVTCLQETRLVACGRSDSDPDPPAASRLSPLVRGTINPIFNKHFVPLTKGDSREAAGGRGLSHFYHGLLGLVLKFHRACAQLRKLRRHEFEFATQFFSALLAKLLFGACDQNACNFRDMRFRVAHGLEGTPFYMLDRRRSRSRILSHADYLSWSDGNSHGLEVSSRSGRPPHSDRLRVVSGPERTATT